MRIYQGDNGKVMSEVFTKSGVAVDLTGATVVLNIKYGELTYTKNITITDAVNGKYEFTLNSNDLPVHGFYFFQANATYADGDRVYSDVDRFIVMKALGGTPVENTGNPGDTSALSRLGISVGGKLTIDGVEQTGGSGNGVLSYETLADLQTAHPNGTNQPVWIVAEDSWYYWDGVEDTTAPNEVTNLAASNVAQTTLTLSWTASTSSDIASYEVYRGSTLLTTVTGTTYNVTSLLASTLYNFTVKAKDTTGNVSTGVQTSITTLAEPEPGDTTAPNNVTNLAYSNVTATGVTLTWTASTSTDVANYQIYKDGVNIGQASGTTFEISGLSASTAYSFTVKAKDTSANEASGVSVNVTTSAPADTTAPVLTITPAATFTTTQTVTMSTNETATIYYTTDGSTPTTSSSVYSTALTLSATTTVKAFAKDTAGNSSSVQTVVYTKETPSNTFLRTNGTSNYLYTPVVTISKLVFDIIIPTGTPNYRPLIETQSSTGTGADYILSSGTGTAFGRVGFSNTVKVNGVTTGNYTQGQRMTVEVEAPAAFTSNANGLEFFCNNARSSTFLGADIYRLTAYNGASVVFDYDMSTSGVQDQSGNGNHGTLVGGTFITV